MRRSSLAAGAAAFLAVLVLAPAPAQAYEPVEVVHTERVQAGPYDMTVGFSRWPIRAQQSLDFSFIPAGGVDGKSGTLEQIGPGIEAEDEITELYRHPRKLDVWGLDIAALPADGHYTFRFTVDGPAGRGVGELRDLPVLAQPGPPMAVSWAVASIPAFVFIAFLAVAWRRVRPSRRLALLDA